MKGLLNLSKRGSRKDVTTDAPASGHIDTSPLGTKRKSFFRRQASLEEAGVFKLSNAGKLARTHPRRRRRRRAHTSTRARVHAECAFLPTELRRRLGRLGNLPPAPSVFKSRGAVMFVDVSGFTSLGEELRASHGPVQGGQMLAERITHVISQLATLCLDFGGDVSKI